jgi:hypothetical protein
VKIMKPLNRFIELFIIYLPFTPQYCTGDSVVSPLIRLWALHPRNRCSIPDTRKK